MEQISEVIQDVRLSSTAKNLLARLWSKELTLPQFMQECAYWALKDGFDELKPWQHPQAPEKVNELEAMPLSQRLKIDYIKLYNEFPQIQEYYEKRFYIKNRNKGMFEWLREMKVYIPQEDTLSHKRIDEKLFEFKASEDELSVEVERAKEIFNASEY